MREKERKRNTLNHEKNGITLIALVVTIVILIILAVISINAVFGENGLLASAERGSIEHTHAMVWEAMEMEYSNYWIDKVMLGGNLITYLQGADKEIIGQELQGTGYVINIDKLLGTRMSLGNGTDGENDVYKLEEVISGTKYSVKYYGPSGNRELGILGDSISSLIESDNPNFEIEKKATSTPPNGEYYTVGDTIEYTITAKNTGDVTIKDIKITDTLTAGSGTYKPGSDKLVLLKEKSSEKVGVGDGYWTISSLDSQETATIIYTYTVQQKDIEAGKIIVNVITQLTGEPQPTVPRGHRIPKEEVPTVPEEEQKPQSNRTFIICKVDANGMPLKGAVIEIYTDKSCSEESFYETIDLRESAEYDHSDNIPPAGKYYIKETVTPDGYTPIDLLEMEITNEQFQEWTIVNYTGIELPESSIPQLKIWTDANKWNVRLTDRGLSYYNDIINFGQPTTLHVYRLGSVDDSGNITYSDSISNISDLPTKVGERWFGHGKESIVYQHDLIEMILMNTAGEPEEGSDMPETSGELLGLELYLDINLNGYTETTTVYSENELEEQTNLFIVACDNIVTDKYEYVHMPILIKVEKGKTSFWGIGEEQLIRKSAIEIVSNMQDYVQELGPMTVCYEIIATSNNEVLYDRIESTIIFENGVQTIYVEEIPVADKIIVKPKYITPSYEIQGGMEEIDVTNSKNVQFDLRRSKYSMTGSSTENSYVFNGSAWYWQNGEG